MKYIAVPRAMFDNDESHWHRADVREPQVYEPQVYERENNSVKTGIIDVRGNPIMRVQETEPIGFIPARTWP